MRLFKDLFSALAISSSRSLSLASARKSQATLVGEGIYLKYHHDIRIQSLFLLTFKI
jgi:hypothetical protein